MDDQPPSRRLRFLLWALLIACGLGIGYGVTIAAETRSTAEPGAAVVRPLGARPAISRTVPDPDVGAALPTPPISFAPPQRLRAGRGGCPLQHTPACRPWSSGPPSRGPPALA